VLLVTGEHGSSKSTLARIVRMLVDPSVAPLRSPPRSERDLAISARLAHVVALNNLDRIDPEMSDALCRLATDGGLSTRALRTDRDEVVFDAVRPIIINGIGDVVTRPDLQDRCLFIRTAPISPSARKGEKEIWSELDRASGKLFGALLGAVSRALRDEPKLVLGELPRLADAMRWATAAEPALGLRRGRVLEAVARSAQEKTLIALEADVIVEPLLAFARALTPGDNGTRSWRGSATKLLRELRHTDVETAHGRRWPDAPNALTARLRRLRAALRAVGVDVVEERTSKQRTLHITYREPVERGSPTEAEAHASPSSGIAASAAPTVSAERASRYPPGCDAVTDGGIGVTDRSASKGNAMAALRGWDGSEKAERVVMPGGQVLDDAFIWSDFCHDALDLDPNELWQELLALPTWSSDKPIPFRERGDDPHWIGGQHPALHYRGRAIKRAKIWCQSDYASGLRKYGYTGWQHRISYATHAVESVPSVQRMAERLNEGLVRSGHAAHNHWIVTRYSDEAENIGFHKDKDRDFSPGSYFIVIKFGAARPFAFRLPGEQKPFLTRVLSAGTAIFVRCKAAGAANNLIEHGVPPVDAPVGMSGSIVSRCIETVIPWDRVRLAIQRNTKAKSSTSRET